MEFVTDKRWYEFPPALRPPLARGGMDTYTLDSRGHIKHTMDALPDEWVRALTALDHSSDMRIRIYSSDKSFAASMVDRYFGKREHAGDDQQQRTTKRPRTWLSDIPPVFWDLQALPPLPPSQSIQVTYQTKSPRPLKPPPPLKQLAPPKPRGQQLSPHSTQKPAKRSAQQNHKQHVRQPAKRDVKLVRQPAKRDVKQQAVKESAKHTIKQQAVQQSPHRAEKNAKQTQKESDLHRALGHSTVKAIEQQAGQESLWQSSKAGQQAADKWSAKQIVDHFVKLTKKPGKPAKQPVEPAKSIKKPKKSDQTVQPVQTHQSSRRNRSDRSDRPARSDRPRASRAFAPAPDEAGPAINVISDMFANINMKL